MSVTKTSKPEGRLTEPSRMRGIQRYLAPGERVLLISRRHPVVLAKPVAVWLLTLVLVGLVSFVITEGNPIPVLDQIVLWIALAMTGATAYKALKWWRAFYVITDERMLLLQGLLSVHLSAVRLSRVAETSFSRTLLGRVLGYGELKLDAPGEQLALATLAYLPRPAEAYRLVNSMLLGDRGEPEPYDPSEEVTGPLPPVVL